METQTLKRKKKEGRSRFSEVVREFLLTHVFDEEDEQRGQARQRRYVFLCIRLALGCVFSFLIARTQLAYSVYPFGIAFLCATGRGTVLYAASSIVSYLTVGGVSSVYACVCAIIILLRSGLCVYFDAKEGGVRRFPLYNEWIAYRVMLCCAASFVVGLYNLFYHSFAYYSLLGSLLCMVACPAGAYIFSCGIDKSRSVEMRDASRLFMCSVLVFSLVDVSVLGVSFAFVCAVCLVFSEAAKKKKGGAALMGLVVGLPFGISSSAVFAISGSLCALLGELSPFLANVGAYTFIVLAFGYLGGYSALLQCLGSATLGVVLVSVWQRYNVSRLIGRMSVHSIADKALAEDDRSPTPVREGAERSMEEVAYAFSSLSNMLRALSRHPDRKIMLDTDAICDGCIRRVCSDCSERAACWDQNERATAEAFLRMGAIISRDGRVSASSAPRAFVGRCVRSDRVLEELNEKTAEATAACMKRSSSDLFASDYDAMSRILSAHLKKTREEGRPDKELSGALSALCRHRLYGIGDILVYGKRKKKIYARNVELSSHCVSAAELRSAFESVCGCRLSYPVYSIDRASVEFEMHTEAAYCIESSISASPKSGEKKSGDTARSVSNSEGYFYGILCDGMGSGAEAAYTSGVCAEYLCNMLCSSNPKELTIEMLNSVIRGEAGECSSTVDLFEFDTYTGEGCFIKSGAAPSFVCRDRNVYKVSAKTIPIGITERIGAEKIKFRLKAGDIVVMISDGVADGDDCRLVVDALCKRTTDDPFDISAAVLGSAKVKNEQSDDMTVICIRILPMKNE